VSVGSVAIDEKIPSKFNHNTHSYLLLLTYLMDQSQEHSRCVLASDIVSSASSIFSVFKCCVAYQNWQTVSLQEIAEGRSQYSRGSLVAASMAETSFMKTT